MNILITGGAGFIGSHLADKLIEKKHKVIIIDDLSCGKIKNINKSAKFYKINILSPKLASIFKKYNPEIVFHHAAQKNVRTSIDNPAKDAKINILGGLYLLECCKNYKIKKFIFASTGGAIYGESSVLPTPETKIPNPDSPYGISKLSFERYLRVFYKIHNIKYTALRYSNVYGPRQDPKGEAGVIAIFINNLLKNKKCTIFGNGKQTRDYIFVHDIVRANILAMQSNKIGEFNIGTGKQVSVNNLFAQCAKLIGSNIQANHGPVVFGEVQKSCLNIKKAKQELKWQPKIILNQGLQRTINWFKKNA